MNQDHLDPEVLAAWLDGSLDPPARAEAEAHAADCARCQAVLAAMIRTEPVLAPKPAWFRAPLRWLVPLATATALAGIWVLVSPGRTPPPAPRPVSVPAPEAPQAAAARSAAVDAVAPSPTEMEKRDARPRVSRDRIASRNEAVKTLEKPATQPGAIAETVTLTDRLARDALTAKPDAAATQSQARPTPPQQAPAQQAPSQQAQVQVTAQTPPVPPAAEATRADAASQRQERRLGPVGAIVGQTASGAVFVSREVASPDLSARWRYGPPAVIQRTVDGGKTWIAQPSGVTTELLAASAPSSTVCWVVGRAGAVALSTDGATWRRVVFREAIDLRSVTATDARTASVTAIDGRVFRTTDGGQTWTR